MNEMRRQYLHFYAGQRALERIRSSGLTPDDIGVIAGAAGGPKWLILGHLDRVLFSDWFKDRQQPLFLVGSSSGAWRMAMASQPDPTTAIKRFEQAYIHQYYSDRPDPAEIGREAERILNVALPKSVVADILHHPYLRINIMAVHCRGMMAREQKLLQMTSMVAAMILNSIHRRGLGLMFDRVLFYDAREHPPLGRMNGFPLVRVPLSRINLRRALMASGAIPLIMPGITGIEGAPSGTYRDGGVIDYHMDLPWSSKGRIVLFPHYTDRIIPGWLDKRFSYRHPHSDDVADMLMLSPSNHFLATLPYCKIPDRKDFYKLAGRDKERVAYWQTAADVGQWLSDEFMEAALSGRIKSLVRPFPWN